MLVAHLAFFVQKHQCRHPSQFEQVHFLFIGIGNNVFRVWQTNIWQAFGIPVTLEFLWVIRADGDNFRVTRGEGRILVTQGGEISAAVGSHKSA